MIPTVPMDLCSANDGQLIERCRQGDQNAYGQMVQRYQSLVCSVAYNRCGDLMLSEDLAQEAFLLAWQKIAELNDIHKFKAWICTIVRNLSIRSVQRRSHSIAGQAAHLDQVADVSAAIIESPIQRLVSEEEERLVWEALADIPEDYREPMILYYREEESVARVAEAMELSEDAVKQRLSRGRKMLKQQVAAFVESTLAKSKPTRTFSSVVLLGIAGMKTASAAGVSTAATVAKSVGVVGSASLFSSLFLGPILQIPLIAWLYKTWFNDIRSERERILFRRIFIVTNCGLLVCAVAIFSSIWWRPLIHPPWLGTLLKRLVYLVFVIPFFIYLYRNGNKIRSLRREEGNDVPLRPIFQNVNGASNAWKTISLFCFSGILVIACLAILPIMARDWLMLSLLLALAIGITLISALLCLRYPKWSLAFYGVGNYSTLLAALYIVALNRSHWKPVIANFTVWSTSFMQASFVTAVVLWFILRKRVYVIRKSSRINA